MKKLILLFLLLFTITGFSAIDKDLEIKVKSLFEKKMEAVKTEIILKYRILLILIK